MTYNDLIKNNLKKLNILYYLFIPIKILKEMQSMEANRNKQIRNFSSGMKQRLKLALAFCADTPLLMLDEPTSNLDAQGVDWYLSLVEKYAAGRLTIICSNQEHEYSFCQHRLSITDYKQ